MALPTKNPGHAEVDRWLRIGLVLWLVLAAIWLTWIPFDFSPRAALRPPLTAPGVVEILGNALLLLPIGFVVGGSPHLRTAALRGLTAGLAISLALELGQAFLPQRIFSIRDILLNTASAVFGSILFARMSQRWAAGRLVLLSTAFVYTLILVHAVHAGGVFRRGLRVSGWQPDFEIAAGDEVGADRRYQGQVWSVQICGGVRPKICLSPGASLEQRMELVRAAEKDQAAEVYARVLSTSNRQTGPTRIATFSKGGFERNITVGQERTDLVIRIRTPLTGPNGRNLELIVPDAIHEGVSTDLHVSFRKGLVRTEVGRDGRRLVAEHRFGALNSGRLLSGPGQVTPDETRRTRLVMLLVLVTAPAIVLVVQFRMLTRSRGWN